jgi:hypothetical protein
MVAITHPRALFPYTGRRYGSFDKAGVRNFMRGSLNIFPHVVGSVRTAAHLSGDIGVESTLVGKIETNP